jgi:hypothetical protein
LWKGWKRTVDFSTLPTTDLQRTVESVEKDRRLFHPYHSGATTNCGKRGKIGDFPTLTTANEGNGASRYSGGVITTDGKREKGRRSKG